MVFKKGSHKQGSQFSFHRNATRFSFHDPLRYYGVIFITAESEAEPVTALCYGA